MSQFRPFAYRVNVWKVCGFQRSFQRGSFPQCSVVESVIGIRECAGRGGGHAHSQFLPSQEDFPPSRTTSERPRPKPTHCHAWAFLPTDSMRSTHETTLKPTHFAHIQNRGQKVGIATSGAGGGAKFSWRSDRFRVYKWADRWFHLVRRQRYGLAPLGPSPQMNADKKRCFASSPGTRPRYGRWWLVWPGPAGHLAS